MKEGGVPSVCTTGTETAHEGKCPEPTDSAGLKFNSPIVTLSATTGRPAAGSVPGGLAARSGRRLFSPGSDRAFCVVRRRQGAPEENGRSVRFRVDEEGDCSPAGDLSNPRPPPKESSH